MNVQQASGPGPRPLGLAAEAWASRFVGPAGPRVAAAVVGGLGADPARVVDGAQAADAGLLRRVVTFAAMSPEFQMA